MVDLNLPNFVTVGLIAILSVIIIKAASKAANKKSPV